LNSDFDARGTVAIRVYIYINTCVRRWESARKPTWWAFTCTLIIQRTRRPVSFAGTVEFYSRRKTLCPPHPSTGMRTPAFFGKNLDFIKPKTGKRSELLSTLNIVFGLLDTDRFFFLLISTVWRTFAIDLDNDDLQNTKNVLLFKFLRSFESFYVNFILL